MKRFYQQVAVREQQQGFILLLDTQQVKTPLKNLLIMPSLELANAIAQEWHQADSEIIPANMPLTGFMNSVIDKITPERTVFNELISAYAQHDVLYYAPDAIQTELNLYYQQHFVPLIEAINQKYDLKITYSDTPMPFEQAPNVIEFAQNYVASLSDMACAAFYQMVSLTGSFFLSMCVIDKQLTPVQAWDYAHHEEDYNIQKWGMDSLQEQKRHNDLKLWQQSLDFLCYC